LARAAKAVEKTAEGGEARARGGGVAKVYEALKHDILDLVLAPGSALDETRIAERFGLSRTPIREALVRLAADGLVATLPNRNTIVAPIDFSTLPAHFDALTLMHRVTTRLAALRRTAKDLEEIRIHQAAFGRAVTAADAIGMADANRDFHLAIARAGRNRYYTELFGRLLDEGRRLNRIYYASFDDHLPAEFVAEHEAIIQAIVDRDADRADSLGRAHAGQVVRQIQGFLASGIGGDVALGPAAEPAQPSLPA
jgi:DNA-binding GntR family transcriptional regulator